MSDTGFCRFDGTQQRIPQFNSFFLRDPVSDTLEPKAPAAAEKLLDAMDKEAAILAEDPYLFPLSHDEQIAHRGIRHVMVKNYMLFYTVNEDEKNVTVIRMLYARRDWIRLLGDVSP